MVVTGRGSGRGVQVASGTDSLSMGVEKCVAWLGARVRWVGCRWWEGVPGLVKLFVPVIRRIGCDRAARDIVGCRVICRRLVRRVRAALDGMLVEGIQCP